jgi:hypothetical protein
MPRAKVKSRPGATRGMVRTSRVRRREVEYIKAHGPCEYCGGETGLEAYWRDRDHRNTHGNIQNYWLSSDEIRADLADKLIVLCQEHMRVHKGGAEHGGGVAGIKGCTCVLCKERRREYNRNRKAQSREKKAKEKS